MINIQDIIPFIKDGWIAMDKSGEWWWYPKKPFIYNNENEWFFDDKTEHAKSAVKLSNLFGNFAPADDWTKSLIKVGGK